MGQSVQTPSGGEITMNELLAMFERMNQQNQANTLEAIRELKKLDPYEQEKLDKQRSREQETRVVRMRESIAHQRGKEAGEFNCELGGHKKHNIGVPNPDHALVGQVNSDGHFRPTCSRCAKQFPKVKATQEQMLGGLKLAAYKNLTPQALYEWHKRTVPECKDCATGGCAVKGLRQLKNGRMDPEPEILPSGKVRAETAVVA